MATVPAPNAWCVILGTPGKDPLTIVGPFQTVDDAGAHKAKHQREAPAVAAIVDVLLNPANC